MGVREDIALLLENSIESFKFALEVRDMAKLYSHLSEVFFDQSYYWLWKMAKSHTIVMDTIYLAKIVYVIQREYHDGPERLVKLLSKEGFEIKTNNGAKIGYMYASKH